MFAVSLLSGHFLYPAEAVVVILGAVWGFWRAIHSLLANNVEAKLKEIQEQTKPNGGGSLRDAIDRIEDEIHAIRRDLDIHLGYHQGRDSRD